MPDEYRLILFITGLNKLFHPVFQGYMLNTMIKIGFSDPQLMAHFVAFNEALWGLLLLLGLLTRLSSFSLIIIMIVALTTKDIHSIPTELIPIDPKIGVVQWIILRGLPISFSSASLIYYAVGIIFILWI
jgi:putative oxidoreductase